MADRPSIRLVPAQPELGREDQPYLRRVPWRWIIPGTLIAAVVIGGYWYKEKQKAAALRAQIIRVHEQELAPITRVYQKLREDLEGRIVQAAREKPETYVEPRLNLNGLRAGKGLYLLLPVGRALSKSTIAQGVSELQGDAIARCMGIAPLSAKDLWSKGSFLLPDWMPIAEARKIDDVMRLRVIDDELSRRMGRDLPDVLKLLRPDWFLLVIQLGKTRLDMPVDVFLWDLRSKKILLSARVQAEGMLVPVRFSTKGAPPPLRLTAESLKGAGATDCSIAAQLKALTGRQVADFDSMIQPPKPQTTPASPKAEPTSPSTKE
jgi:hypothetical protein